MTTINGSGTGATYTNTINTDRQAWLDSQARVDALYSVEEAKRFETLSKAELKNSSNPLGQFGRMKLSDNERSILAEVAKINGWSRQGTEAMYKMAIATDKNLYSIGGYLKGLTQIEPGYFKDGGTTLGLTEADRRRLLGIPEDYEEPVVEMVDKALARIDSITGGASAGNNNPVVPATDILGKELNSEEQAALSEAAAVNGLNEQSVVAYYRIYLSQNSEPSINDFLQLLTQSTPDSYDKDGRLKHSDDNDRVLHVEI